MRLLISCCAGLALILASGSALAQPNAPLPPEVAAQRAQDVAGCRQDGGARADFSEGASPYLQQGDFNGDGRTDYIIFHGAYACDVGGGVLDKLGCSASEGCMFYSFTSLPSGRYQRTEGWMIEEIAIEHRGTRDVIRTNQSEVSAWNGQAWGAVGRGHNTH